MERFYACCVGDLLCGNQSAEFERAFGPVQAMWCQEGTLRDIAVPLGGIPGTLRKLLSTTAGLRLFHGPRLAQATSESFTAEKAQEWPTDFNCRKLRSLCDMAISTFEWFAIPFPIGEWQLQLVLGSSSHDTLEKLRLIPSVETDRGEVPCVISAKQDGWPEPQSCETVFLSSSGSNACLDRFLWRGGDDALIVLPSIAWLEDAGLVGQVQEIAEELSAAKAVKVWQEPLYCAAMACAELAIYHLKYRLSLAAISRLCYAFRDMPVLVAAKCDDPEGLAAIYSSCDKGNGRIVPKSACLAGGSIFWQCPESGGEYQIVNGDYSSIRNLIGEIESSSTSSPQLLFAF